MVRKIDRNKSTMEYVNNAEKLVKYTTSRCLKVPKRLTFVITTNIMQTVQSMYIDVVYIRNLYTPTNEHKLKRIELTESAISKLEYLGFMLELLYVCVKNLFTEHQWDEWIEIINQEITLLKGVKAK